MGKKILASVKHFWNRLPRKLRVFLHSICIVLAVVAICYLAEAPATPMDAEGEFRMEAKRNLVGPVKILDRMDYTDGSSYETLFVAEDDYGFVTYDTSGEDLQYFPKAEPLTFASVFASRDDKYRLKILIADKLPDAVSVQLDAVIKDYYSGKNYGTDRLISLETVRGSQGYFLFTYDPTTQYTVDELGQMHYFLSSFADHAPKNLQRTTNLYDAELRLRFYDAAGKLLKSYYFDLT